MCETIGGKKLKIKRVRKAPTLNKSLIIHEFDRKKVEVSSRVNIDTPAQGLIASASLDIPASLNEVFAANEDVSIDHAVKEVSAPPTVTAPPVNRTVSTFVNVPLFANIPASMENVIPAEIVYAIKNVIAPVSMSVFSSTSVHSSSKFMESISVDKGVLEGVDPASQDLSDIINADD